MYVYVSLVAHSRSREKLRYSIYIMPWLLHMISESIKSHVIAVIGMTWLLYTTEVWKSRVIVLVVMTWLLQTTVVWKSCVIALQH